jgi:hypothetical protein
MEVLVKAGVRNTERNSRCDKYRNLISLFVRSGRIVRRKQWTSTRKSIALEVSPYNEHALAVVGAGQLRDALDGIEPLQGAALGKNNVHLQPIADLDGRCESSCRKG